jgi:hypothetical protein
LTHGVVEAEEMNEVNIMDQTRAATPNLDRHAVIKTSVTSKSHAGEY